MQKKGPIIVYAAGGLKLLPGGHDADGTVNGIGVRLRTERAGIVNAATHGEQGELTGLAKINDRSLGRAW
jgi:hypothetical protein